MDEAKDWRRDMGVLLDYFRSNAEFQRMNRITYQYGKCVMTLPLGYQGREGTTAWFLQLWKQMPDRYKRDFEIAMSEMLPFSMPAMHGLPRRHEFRVDVLEAPSAEHVVIFYIMSGLERLAAETFQWHQQRSPFVQALALLHSPHPEYRAFTAKAYDLEVEYGDRRLMMRLSGLLAQLTGE